MNPLLTPVIKSLLNSTVVLKLKKFNKDTEMFYISIIKLHPPKLKKKKKERG